MAKKTKHKEQRGILFLDEVSNISEELQAKLLEMLGKGKEKEKK